MDKQRGRTAVALLAGLVVGGIGGWYVGARNLLTTPACCELFPPPTGPSPPWS